jgi:hypothetical protein
VPNEVEESECQQQVEMRMGKYLKIDQQHLFDMFRISQIAGGRQCVVLRERRTAGVSQSFSRSTVEDRETAFYACSR